MTRQEINRAAAKMMAALYKEWMNSDMSIQHRDNGVAAIQRWQDEQELTQ